MSRRSGFVGSGEALVWVGLFLSFNLRVSLRTDQKRHRAVLRAPLTQPEASCAPWLISPHKNQVSSKFLLLRNLFLFLTVYLDERRNCRRLV